MDNLSQKFQKLGTDNAPGQEVRQAIAETQMNFRGNKLPGKAVDFSHGDVDAFEPTPGALEEFTAGFHQGGAQAYTEYRGSADIRAELATKLTLFTGKEVDGDNGLMITTGTQGALFLAMASCVTRGSKVAIVQPDYFANRKLVEFFDGEILPVQLDYLGNNDQAGLDLNQLEAAFKAGAQVFLFSNPNNPTGVVYSHAEIQQISVLAQQYNAVVIVDQLYSRLLYANQDYHHLRAERINPENVITIMGPSKAESLSGFRLGVAFGSTRLIDRMEKLQAIVALRAAGYNQAVLKTWFSEPQGWFTERIALHQSIRDDILSKLTSVDGLRIRTPQAGSYLFPQLPELAVSPADFIRLLRVQAGVTVTPGSEFSPHTLNSLRLNFSQDHQAAVQAMDRCVEMIQRYRK